MKTTVRSLHQQEFNLGKFAFPGRPSSQKGEEAERLQATIRIVLKDNVTREQQVRLIPFATDSVDKLVAWFEQVMTHPRTIGDLRSFCASRDGGPDDLEDDEV